MRIALVLALALAVGLAAAPARAADWCGTGSSATDRRDTVGGSQIHVVYAYPSDGRDRLQSVSSTIVTDLTSIDTWWRGADSSRTPRFDLAAFTCDTTLGAADISSIELPHPSSYFVDAGTRFTRVVTDLNTAGFTNARKKYLVYYDATTTLPAGSCGSASIEPRTGTTFAVLWFAPNLEAKPTAGCGSLASPSVAPGYTAFTAARELVHALGALDTSAASKPPHACASDATSPCDSSADVLAPTPSVSSLDGAVLDAGHDDYYAHSGSWWDVQDSAFLRRVNAAQVKLTVAVGSNGSVGSDVPGGACPSGTCTSTWDAGSTVVLTATPATGYRFVGWSGACSGTSSCSLTLSADTSVAATFAAAATTPATPTTPKPTSTTIGPDTLRVHVTRKPPTLVAVATLNRSLGGKVTCNAGASFKVLEETIVGSEVTCRWSVPASASRKKVSATMTVESGKTVVVVKFGYRIPRL